MAKNFDFSSLRFAVLDEADIMLNLGFKEDVEHIMGTIKAAALIRVASKFFMMCPDQRWVLGSR